MNDFDSLLEKYELIKPFESCFSNAQLGQLFSL